MPNTDIFNLESNPIAEGERDADAEGTKIIRDIMDEATRQKRLRESMTPDAWEDFCLAQILDGTPD